MLKLSNIKVPIDEPHDLSYYAARIIGANENEIKNLIILKKSLDSRRKSEINFIYTVAFDVKNEEKYAHKAEKYTQRDYIFPYKDKLISSPVVIVGAGPAGLFAALTLTEAGVKCIILERGKNVDERIADVEKFWESGALNEESNIQFGEGGAGTFSDGKLMTGIRDSRISYVFRRFVEFGAPEEILYLAKPHIGTDNLRKVVKNMRTHLEVLGCDVRFESKLTGLDIQNGAVCGVYVTAKDGEYEIKTDSVILAIGNSARDTFRMLNESGIPMSPKSFAVGVRIEHKQKDVDLAQYGEAATLGTLPAADYKLAEHLENGRGVFTFCVCPGGSVVSAGSEKGRVCTNGMSEHARDKENINGGLLVGVDPEDFGNRLFGGLEFQESLEAKVFEKAGGSYRALCQTVGDLLDNVPSKTCGKVVPSFTGGVTYGDLREVFPDFIIESIVKALPKMDKKIHGFASRDAVLTAAETRSSSPVRILRDDGMMSRVRGIYPCGEGAGFAGGITTSAVDGIKCAEEICEKI